MNIPLVKLKAMILYFANETDPQFLGKVKLMKLFYFSDFMHVKRYGVPITYDNYVHMEKGPVPSAIKNLIDDADEDINQSDLADIIYFEYPKDIAMHKIKAKSKFTEEHLKYFSEAEMEVLEAVKLRFGDKNMKYVVDESHKEAPWSETDFLEFIPYSLAAHDPDSLVSEEEIKILTSISQT
jgi:uncharacterized phage-associated protein